MATRERDLIDDRYALDGLIAHGGMADVYRAHDRLLLRPVAVKVLREVSDPVQRDRFVDEARTLAGLNHRGLVTLLDAGISQDQPYLVMELIDGVPLSQRITQGALPAEEVRAIAQQLAEALAYAHERGVVHRDVKPSNVLLEDDRALLVDFGIARLVGATEHHTRTGTSIGSPAYLAPEQVACEPITPAADVYSLGLVLLEALTGVRAFTGAPVEAAVARLSKAPAIPATVDPGWQALIERMTQRDPAARPSAADVAAAMASGTTPRLAAVPAYGVADAAETATQDLPALVRRSRRTWLAPMLLALGALAAVALLVVSPRLGRITDHLPPTPSQAPRHGPATHAPRDQASTGPLRTPDRTHPAKPTRTPRPTHAPATAGVPASTPTAPASTPSAAATSTPSRSPSAGPTDSPSPASTPTAASAPAATDTAPAISP